MKRQIEIFTAGCTVCEPVVHLVKETAGKDCEITLHNLSEQCESKICVSKMKEYGVKRVPAIAVNGKLLDCCTNIQITKDDLTNAGIGNC
ncbi:glutaredoxin [Gilvibacter sp. SZ-19]|uniref:thioredoxin family protein n=1 Tax=Gilvibacter sp. SZ-19 TaxID=754429 RepID=UPI000B3D1A95|nr:thioredoxin family protein [Gilvibacter sp. SZ-19]ARV12346.1 glutaredoxin [Gilvibacter sp. SZ-19]